MKRELLQIEEDTPESGTKGVFEVNRSEYNV